MTTADRRKRKREEMRKAEAASCRNLMKFFSRFIHTHMTPVHVGGSKRTAIKTSTIINVYTNAE
jgi:uncharacterized protein YcsI (UPF0317 family)